MHGSRPGAARVAPIDTPQVILEWSQNQPPTPGSLTATVLPLGRARYVPRIVAIDSVERTGDGVWRVRVRLPARGLPDMEEMTAMVERGLRLDGLAVSGAAKPALTSTPKRE